MPQLYDNTYAYLEIKFKIKWTWDAETKAKTHGLYAASSSFEYIAAFSVLFNGLEPLKTTICKNP